MNISIPFLTFSWGWNAFFQSSGYGISQSHYVPLNVTISHDYEALFLNNVPPGFVNVSCLFVKENLAVIPGDWKAGDIKTAFYNMESDQPSIQAVMNKLKSTDFIAWDPLFFEVIGQKAALERIQSFEGQHPTVHEAPAYVPETNELIYADTSVTGWLWAIDLDTLKAHKLKTTPPLHNVNGARYHKGNLYLTTNGGRARGIWSLNPIDGTATPIVNNYRGRHLNSPNDLVFDSESNMWFTDPPYGWFQGFPGVQAPELPTAIYFMNMTSKALKTVSNSIVTVPNGLDFSPDGSVLYVSDSNTTAGRPLEHHPASVRNVWAFDVNGAHLSNARVIHQAEGGWPDGIQVTGNGYIFVAGLGGVDIIDPKAGFLIGKINTPGDIVFNLERGPRREGQRLWLLTGTKYIYKVILKES